MSRAPRRVVLLGATGSIGQNALRVIGAVKAKLRDVQHSMPLGVKIVPAYDRSWLISQSINTLRRTLIEEAIVVSIVIIIFLFHFRSALVPILALLYFATFPPLGVMVVVFSLYYFAKFLSQPFGWAAVSQVLPPNVRTQGLQIYQLATVPSLTWTRLTSAAPEGGCPTGRPRSAARDRRRSWTIRPRRARGHPAASPR